MKRADYKCLDDLIAEGLDPKVKEKAEETGLYIRTIHAKDSVADVKTEDILKREPWQANPHCLKSLFSKIPDRRALLKGQLYKGLTTLEIEENMRQCNNDIHEVLELPKTVTNDTSLNKKVGGPRKVVKQS